MLKKTAIESLRCMVYVHRCVANNCQSWQTDSDWIAMLLVIYRHDKQTAIGSLLKISDWIAVVLIISSRANNFQPWQTNSDWIAALHAFPVLLKKQRLDRCIACISSIAKHSDWIAMLLVICRHDKQSAIGSLLRYVYWSQTVITFSECCMYICFCQCPISGQELVCMQAARSANGAFPGTTARQTAVRKEGVWFYIMNVLLDHVYLLIKAKR